MHNSDVGFVWREELAVPEQSTARPRPRGQRQPDLRGYPNGECSPDEIAADRGVFELWMNRGE